jgi:hypothetical protein
MIGYQKIMDFVLNNRRRLNEMVNFFYRVIFIFCICALALCFWSGCTTASNRRADVSGYDYIKPATIETADYAIRERIHALEQQIADARSTVAELRASSERIRDVSRRSANTVQEIIKQMEALVVWIDWATDYIQRLETILEDKI